MDDKLKKKLVNLKDQDIHLPSQEDLDRLFSSSSSDNIESHQDVITRFSSEQSAEEKLEIQLNEISHKIDVASVSSLSHKIIDTADEIQLITNILIKNPSRISNYKSTLDDLVHEGNVALADLFDQLKSAGVFEYLGDLSIQEALLNKSISDLPQAELEMLDKLLPDLASRKVTISLYKAIVSGYTCDIEIMYRKAQQILPNATQQLNSTQPTEQTPAINRLHGIVKFIGGFGLIGLNIAGYISTKGMFINPYQAWSSAITGLAMATDGADKLGIVNEWINKRTKGYTPKIEDIK